MEKFKLRVINSCVSTVKNLTSYRPNVLTTSAKPAFTLAEVLITLAIIGVVAAMTMPTLITKYQMKTFEVGLKKQYLVLQNTLNYLGQEEGLNQCYTELLYNSDGVGYYSTKNTQCTDLKNALISKLKLSTITYDYKTLYKSSNAVIANGGRVTNSSVSYDTLFKYNNSQSYLIADGAVIIMYPPEKLQSYFSSALIIDVNGKKGPNKWGYDVFYLSFTKKKNQDILFLSDNYGTIVEKGGLRPLTIISNETKNSNFSSVQK